MRMHASFEMEEREFDRNERLHKKAIALAARHSEAHVGRKHFHQPELNHVVELNPRYFPGDSPGWAPIGLASGFSHNSFSWILIFSCFAEWYPSTWLSTTDLSSQSVGGRHEARRPPTALPDLTGPQGRKVYLYSNLGAVFSPWFHLHQLLCWSCARNAVVYFSCMFCYVVCVDC